MTVLDKVKKTIDELEAQGTNWFVIIGLRYPITPAEDAADDVHHPPHMGVEFWQRDQYGQENRWGDVLKLGDGKTADEIYEWACDNGRKEYFRYDRPQYAGDDPMSP